LREETRQHLGEEFGHRRGVGEDTDVAGRIGAVFGELAFQVIHLAHDQPRVLQQLLPGGRQLHTTAVAIQQAAVELAFQRLDPRAGRRRREVRAAGALGQAGRFGDMDEQAQIGQIEMHGRASYGGLAFSLAERRCRKIQIPGTLAPLHPRFKQDNNR